ncbi:acyl-CoA carboxylase epsilon subunit [Streptomyces meridianus]|uniref:Acyl-CoA carboxylase subunit epsilon n=1 Tax=Streptomyces meridianus TaxID=2938945 RepID=A0ABT0X2E8_9ACTN|nr:acyl-CoA carboxylase epsilon subunit [Streptomyces meridianus]MCM2576715.1 acyl-CoA carboxylase subunit epsilon [Streptomyces meridianus]
MNTTTHNLVRVERGHAAPEELAALTAVLLARAAAGSHHHAAAAARPGRSAARWRRLERTPGFRAPHSWQG